MKFEFSETPSDDGIVQKCPVKKLVLGVFFDGTNNNFHNIKALRNAEFDPKPEINRINRYGKDKDSSYQDFFTNVAWLYEMYQTDSDACDDSTIVGKIYIDGIGTTTGEEDSTLSGKGLGIGATGVNQRVEEAIKKITFAINSRINPPFQTLDSVTIDVFGFSRGATAARVFVHRLFDAHISTNINFRFLGLFDTVVSIENKQNILRLLTARPPSVASFYQIFKSVQDYSTVVRTKKEVELLNGLFKKTFHLCAKNEYRAKFALRSILEKGQGSSSSFEEMTMIGAHADIGGGYRYGTVIEHYTQQVGAIGTFKDKSSGIKYEKAHQKQLQVDAKERSFIIFRQEKLLDRSTINLAETVWENIKPKSDIEKYEDEWACFYQYECTREIKPGLSIVALHLMYDKATKAGVSMKPIQQAKLSLGRIPEIPDKSTLHKEQLEKTRAKADNLVVNNSHRYDTLEVHDIPSVTITRHKVWNSKSQQSEKFYSNQVGDSDPSHQEFGEFKNDPVVVDNIRIRNKVMPAPLNEENLNAKFSDNFRRQMNNPPDEFDYSNDVQDSKESNTRESYLVLPKLDEVCQWYLGYLRGEQGPNPEFERKLLTNYVHMSALVFNNSTIDNDGPMDMFTAPIAYSPESTFDLKSRKIDPNKYNDPSQYDHPNQYDGY